jgi:predicted DNA binding CopG/RHH family protein
MIKQVPRLTTDEEAEQFLKQDLSGLDFSQFKPVDLSEEPFQLQLPGALVAAINNKAALEGISSERFIRQALERALALSK